MENNQHAASNISCIHSPSYCHEIGPAANRKHSDESRANHRPTDSSVANHTPADSSVANHRPTDSSVANHRRTDSSVANHTPAESSLANHRSIDSSKAELSSAVKLYPDVLSAANCPSTSGDTLPDCTSKSVQGAQQALFDDVSCCRGGVVDHCTSDLDGKLERLSVEVKQTTRNHCPTRQAIHNPPPAHISTASAPCDSSADEPSAPPGVHFVNYSDERQMPDIMRLMQGDLSEPYSIYTYRYFINNWPHLCFLAYHEKQVIGAVVCKLDSLESSECGAARHHHVAPSSGDVVKRGYIAMLAVDKTFRKQNIGSLLVRRAIKAMILHAADEVVLETEVTNLAALRLYENLGFVRDKRLFRYYLNGGDALRLKLWLRAP